MKHSTSGTPSTMAILPEDIELKVIPQDPVIQRGDNFIRGIVLTQG